MVVKWIGRLFEAGLVLLFLMAAAVGIYIMIDANYVYSGAREYQELRNYLPEEERREEVLRTVSGNAVAWVSVDETPVDYPILQAEDNMEYLSKDPDGNYSMAGSIFLDFRNRADFSDPYNIVYGHHMPEKLMFGALDDFADPQYFESHRSGTLYLPEKQYSFQTAAFLVVDAGCEEIFETETGTDFSSFCEANALNWHPESMTEHLTALTTCAEDDRFREVLLLALSEIEP